MFEFAIWLGIVLPLVFSMASLVGQRRPTDLGDYLVCSKSMSRHHFVATLSASNAALANILFLFAYWGYVYGAWAIVWSAAFWGLGFLLFSLVARRPVFGELMDPQRPELGLNEILGRQFRSVGMLKVAAFVSALAFLFLLSLELNVGSRLFAVFVPNHPPAAPYALALGFGLVLAIYTAMGGFPMVVRTDLHQLILVVLACVAIPFCVNAMLPPNVSVVTLLATSFSKDPAFELSWRYVPFVFGSLFSWGLWFVCTMDMWQRSMAVRSTKKDIGLWGILPGYVVLIVLSGIGVLVGLFVRYKLQQPFPPKFPLITFAEMLAKQASSDPWLALGLAVTLAGFLGALLSTVDTYMVLVAQSLAGDIKSSGKVWLGDIAKQGGDASAFVLRRIKRVTGAIPFLAVGLFWMSVTVAQQDTFTLYMIAGSIPLALAPASLVVLFSASAPIGGSKRLSRLAVPASAAMLIAVVAGILVNFWLANKALTTYDAKCFGLLYFVPALIAAIAALPLLRLLKKGSND